MFQLRYTNHFKRNLKLLKKQGKDLSKLNEVLDLLTKGEPLPIKYKDHSLTGNYSGCRECHIEPDWLLIYEVINNELVIILVTTGSHSELF